MICKNDKIVNRECDDGGSPTHTSHEARKHACDLGKRAAISVKIFFSPASCLCLLKRMDLLCDASYRALTLLEQQLVEIIYGEICVTRTK